MWKCKHCKCEFDKLTISEKANHSRWCNENPKRNDTTNLKLAQQKRINDILGNIIAFEVLCEMCTSKFIVYERERKFPSKSKYYCSKSCSSSVGGFAKWKKYGYSAYRTICFKYHKKECIVCGENKIVSVHHYDKNHKNNNPKNLIPVCPTHHQYLHSPWKSDIDNVVNEYFTNWRLP